MQDHQAFKLCADDLEIEVPLREATLGRDTSCQIVIRDDPSLSRRHARIRRAPEGVVVEDLGSANGTYVDGTRITGPMLLAGGEIVRFGSKQFRLVAGAPDLRIRDVTRGDLPRNVTGPGDVAPPAPALILEEKTTAAEIGEQTRREDAFFEGEGSPLEESDAVLNPEVLSSLIHAVRQRPADRRPSERLVRTAAKSALRLADGTGDVKWVTLALELYAESAYLMPPTVVELVEPFLWKLRGADPKPLVSCVKNLEANRAKLDGAGNAALARLRAQAIALGARV